MENTSLLQDCEAYLCGLGFVKDDNPNGHYFNLDVPSWGVYSLYFFKDSLNTDRICFHSSSDNSHLIEDNPDRGVEENTTVDYMGVSIENVGQLEFCLSYSTMMMKYRAIIELIRNESTHIHKGAI